MRISMFVMSLLFLATQSLDCLSQTVGGISGTSPAGSFVFPGSPTTDDLIGFNLTVDGMTYGNQCEQLRGFGGAQFEIFVDESSRSIRVGVTGTHGGACLANFDPVNGLEGSVGPLAAGDWEIRASFPGLPPTFPPIEPIAFTVTPAAEPVLLGDVNKDGRVDFFDLFPFITVLFSREFQAEADINEDGVVNFLDISGFFTGFPGQ